MIQVTVAQDEQVQATGDVQFSTREIPWMKLGRLVGEPVVAAEAAKLGGLDFEVEKRPLWFGDAGDPKTAKPTTRIAERFAVVRTDTDQWLGIMSKDYPLLQYGEAFSFMDTVSSRYVAAGALKGGRQGFLVVQAPETVSTMLSATDPHDLYVVLRTSHDGSRAVEASIMPLRRRCMNQLTLPSFAADVPYRWSVPHTSTMAEKLTQAQVSLQNLGGYAERFAVNAGKLMKIKLTQPQAETLLKSVLPDRPKRDTVVETITTAWHTSETVGFDWTGWGLLNSVSDYMDWGRAGGSPESRFVNALQGSTHRTLSRVAGRLLTRF